MQEFPIASTRIDTSFESSEREKAEELIRQIHQCLASQNATTISYNEGSERTGWERFVVVDNTNHSLSAYVVAVSQGGGVNDIGLSKYDYVEVVWIDKRNLAAGMVSFIDNPEVPFRTNKISNISPTHIQFWENGGALKYHPISKGVGMSVKDLQTVLQLLRLGNVNKEVMNKGMNILKRDYPFQVVESAKFSSETKI